MSRMNFSYEAPSPPSDQQVPEARVDVLRLDGRSGHVDDGEGLGEANEVAAVLEGPGTLAVGGVHGAGRAADGNELCVPGADPKRPGRTRQGELGRRRGDGRLDQVAPEAHLKPFDGAAGVCEESARPLVVDLHAELLEHGERGRVGLRDLVVRVAPGERKGARQMAVVDGAGGRFGHSSANAAAAVSAPPRPRRLIQGSAPGANGHPR